ncbi:MAG: serine/threonine protein kinaselike protein [Actinomycetia bacterium]|nr:serine/threonine protein kinaselike protein [Actinomycetes bacterium]
MRTRLGSVRIAAPLAVLAGVILTAGCSAGTASAGAPASPVTPSAPAAAAPAPAKNSGSGTDTKPAHAAPAARKTSACTAGNVKVTVIGQADRTQGSTRMAMILVENASSRTCHLDGWTSVALVNAAGDEVRVPVRNVSQPGAPTAIDLPPGTSAAAGMKWTVCDKGSATCNVGNGLRVGPPRGGRVNATLQEFPSAEKSAITMASLQVGSLQPSKQGVVAW